MTAASSTDQGSPVKKTPVWLRCLTGSLALALLYLVYRVDSSLDLPWVSVILVVILGTVMMAEYQAMLSRGGVGGHPTIGTFCAAAGLLALKVQDHSALPGLDPDTVLLFFVLILVLLFVVEVVRGDAARGPVRIANTLLGVFLIYSYSYLLDILMSAPAPLGIQCALLVVLVAKASDIGGYLIGNLVGGPKLAPRVSPKKTISGSAGGLVLSIAVAIVGGVYLLGQLTWVEALIFGVLLGAASQLGDLSESLIKRWLGTKDSSTALPTFGGVFDLVDSLIFAAPVGYWFLRAVDVYPS